MLDEKILTPTFLIVSYAFWVVFTIWIYGKIRKVWVYDLYFMLLYSIPLVYKAIETSYAPLSPLMATLFSILFFLWDMFERNKWKTILIPLPEIIAVVVEYASHIT